MREATIEDMDRIGELQLSDFAAPLAQIEVPQDERLSDEQMNRLVGEFLDVSQRS